MKVPVQDITMIPCQYSETVAVAEIPAHQEHICVTYCDLETNTRCKTGVTIGPGLCPTSYRDSVIVYLDSTRRRYVSRIEYSTRLKPLSYSETSYTRPHTTSKSFATLVDHHPESNRKWFKSSVRLEPKVYSSTHSHKISDHRKYELADRKSEASSSVGALTDADASMESLDYLSDGATSSPEVPSPLRMSSGGDSPLDNTRTVTSIRTYSYLKETNGNTPTYSQDRNANEVMTHRSGPFIYNVPKRKTKQRKLSPYDEHDQWEDQQINGYPEINGYHQEHTTSNHYTNGYHMTDPYDDITDL